MINMFLATTYIQENLQVNFKKKSKISSWSHLIENIYKKIKNAI